VGLSSRMRVLHGRTGERSAASTHPERSTTSRKAFVVLWVRPSHRPAICRPQHRERRSATVARSRCTMARAEPAWVGFAEPLSPPQLSAAVGCLVSRCSSPRPHWLALAGVAVFFTRKSHAALILACNLMIGRD
jgi:hypothetical protein